jgi:hypothetical protein
MACSSVDAVAPVIRSGESLFVTYKPYNVTFDERGNPVSHLPALTVPLTRSGS